MHKPPLVGALLLLLSGTPAFGQPAGPLRLTFVSSRSSALPDTFLYTVARGVESASLDLGVSTRITGPKYIAESSLIVQAIESAISARVDGIITTYVEHPRFRETLQKAADQGIPVVLLDTDAPQTSRLTYIGIDNFAAGVAAAHEVLKVTGGQGRIGVVSGAVPQTSTQKQRIEGFEAGIAPYSGLRIVDKIVNDEDILTQSDAILGMLQHHPGMNVLFCVDGGSSTGATIVLKQNQLSEKVALVCFDMKSNTLENIQDGIITAVLVQDGFRAGYEAVRTLVNQKKGIRPPARMIFSPITFTKDNLAQLKQLLERSSVPVGLKPLVP